MLTRFKKLTRKKKVTVFAVLLLLMLSACHCFLNSSYYFSNAALDDRLEKKGIIVHRTYTGPAFLKPIAKSMIRTNYKSMVRSLFDNHTLEGTGSDIDDELCKQIAKADYSKLFLPETKVTDEGVKALIELEPLEFISLQNNSITDKSIPYFLEMPLLKKLNINGTKITLEGYQELKSKLPGCQIAYRSSNKSIGPIVTPVP